MLNVKDAAADPREVPAYTVAEAAHLVGVPVSTLKTWIHGSGKNGLVVLKPGSPRLLTFSNLVEAFVLATLRRSYKFSFVQLRTAMTFLQKQLGIRRPLIDAKFETDGVDLFVDHLSHLLNTRDGQTSIRPVLESYLKRIKYDHRGQAVRFFPVFASSNRKVIVIDPERGFGRPILTKGGARVDVIVSRYRAGESTESIAKDYGVANGVIEEAVRSELRAAS